MLKEKEERRLEAGVCGSYILFLTEGRLCVGTSGWARGVGESEKNVGM